MTGFGFQRNDFFLVIMTKFMKKMIKTYGDLLAIDGTHNTTPYGYKLVTLMVVDTSTNCGYPVAYCIAPAENESVSRRFCSVSRLRVITRVSLLLIVLAGCCPGCQ